MAINKVGLKRAQLTSGDTPRGQRVYLVGSDTRIGTDISPILDATLGGDSVPDYDEAWDGSTNSSLLVFNKVAEPFDIVDGGTQEGHWWIVTVDYSVPDVIQRELDPKDRDWEWSKGQDKREFAAASSTFDTSGYIYPGSDETYMINLGLNQGFQNTLGEPPESGVSRVVSRQVISLTKYVSKVTPAALGVADWDELDSFVDKVNTDTVEILDITYDPYELLIDSIPYQNVTENGFECVKVTFNIIADKTFKHIFTFQNASYNQAGQDGTEWVRIPIKDQGQDVNTPQLIDDEGKLIPLPESPPFLKTPYLISGGVNDTSEFDGLTLPATIP
jgi:hypothetical protein